MPTKAEVLAELARRGVDVSNLSNKNGGMLEKQDAELVSKYRDEASRALNIAQQAEKFGELNRETGTGGLRSIGLPQWLGGGSVADIAGWFDPNIGAMKAITNRVTPTFRQAGSGASTDKDDARFESSFPNIKNTGPSNAKIRQQLIEDSTMKGAKAQFYRTWFEKRGNLQGADLAFQSFWSKRQKQQQAQPSKAQAQPQADVVIDVFGRPVR